MTSGLGPAKAYQRSSGFCGSVHSLGVKKGPPPPQIDPKMVAFLYVSLLTNQPRATCRLESTSHMFGLPSPTLFHFCFCFLGGGDRFVCVCVSFYFWEGGVWGVGPRYPKRPGSGAEPEQDAARAGRRASFKWFHKVWVQLLPFRCVCVCVFCLSYSWGLERRNVSFFGSKPGLHSSPPLIKGVHNSQKLSFLVIVFVLFHECMCIDIYVCIYIYIMLHILQENKKQLGFSRMSCGLLAPVLVILFLVQYMGLISIPFGATK